MPINWKLPETYTEQAFELVTKELAEEMTLQLEDPKWEWSDRVTVRKEGVGVTGRIARSPRDIVDTGLLRDSLTVTRRDYLSVLYEYPIDYAAIVHQGATLSSGAFIPARPWVTEAVKDYDPLKALKDELGI